MNKDIVLQIKTQLTDNIMLALFLTLVPVSLVTLINAIALGWTLHRMITPFFFLICSVFYVFRSYILYKFKVAILMTFLLILSVSSFYHYGLMSMGVSILLVCGVTSVLLLEVKYAYITMGFGLLVFMIFSYLYGKGILVYKIDPTEYLSSFSTWTMQIVSFVSIHLIILFSLKYVLRKLIQVLKDDQDHIAEIELNNNEIQALYEETHAINEELEHSLSMLDSTYMETIIALANAIEASDAYTRGHCERVKNYALMIADSISLGRTDKRNLEMAALLHDIGKIGVSVDVLNKETPLTENEINQIRKHSAIGFDILKGVNFLSESAKIIYQHHERIDGKGYFGLKGDEILLLSKIISISDAFDAMTSTRAYRKIPLTRSEAFNELNCGKGSQFDARLVDIFIARLETI